MNSRVAVFFAAVSLCALPIHAAEVMTSNASASSGSGPSVSTTTISASTLLAPGSYMATVAPGFNGDMATRMEKMLKPIPGLKSPNAIVQDSSIHFVVKNGAHVRVADIQKAVSNAYSGAVVSTPILEHSMNANPGL